MPSTESAAPRAVDEGALAGLRVVELGEMVSGPYGARLLADFGADVVRVENSGQPDPARRYGPFPDGVSDPDHSGLYLYLNANKRSVALDRGPSQGAELLLALVRAADILVTNWSSDRLQAAGLDLAQLRIECPELIITAISPFGFDGPRREWQSGELVLYAMGGLAFGSPGMPDVAEDLELEPPLHPNAFVAGTVSGVVSSVATMLAVTRRELHGGGALIDISEQAAVAAMDQRDITAWVYGGVISGRHRDTVGRMPNYYLPCRDGYAVIAAPLDHMWPRLIRAMGEPEWALTDAFVTAEARSQNWDALRLLLMDWSMQQSSERILEIGREYGIPLFPYHSVGQVVESPHTKERESLAELSVAGNTFKVPAPPIHMSVSPWQLRRPAPRLGEHTSEVLAEWLANEGGAA